MDVFCRRIRDLRIDHDLTQRDMAERLGVSQNMVSNYENGREPDFATILAYADYFKVSVDYLFGRSLVPDSAPGVSLTAMQALDAPLFAPDDIAKLAAAFIAYYKADAPGGSYPARAISGFIDHLTEALSAAVNRDDAQLLSAIDAATLAALELPRMLSYYYMPWGMEKKGE